MSFQLPRSYVSQVRRWKLGQPTRGTGVLLTCVFFFFINLDTGPRRPLSLEPSHDRFPQVRRWQLGQPARGTGILAALLYYSQA